MAAAAAVSGRWTRVRTLGRGASGAVVSLAADEATGALFAVKSAPACAAEQLRHEGAILSALRSPHVLPCLGFRAAGHGGECQLFLEFAPGGSLADAAARSGGGRLGERAVRGYAADVARGLAYLHGLSLVHGDVKPANVVIGADGRAKLADFGCARPALGSASARPLGGTPAFMAPEVARGEEQGPAADVWALGCTVLELATGRAPWSGVRDLLAAVHRIGFTDATPEVPAWMSAEAKDFLARCFVRDPRRRCSAAELLEHPFLAPAGGKAEEEVAARWVSPKSTLDAALWESDSDDSDDEDHVSESPAQRIKELAAGCSALPDWDSDDGDWIQGLGEQCEKACNLVPVKEAAKEMASEDEHRLLLSEVLETEEDFVDADAEDADPECSVAVGLAAPSVELCRGSWSHPSVIAVATCRKIEMSKKIFTAKLSPLTAKLKCQKKILQFALVDYYPIHIGSIRILELPNNGCVATCDDSRNIILDQATRLSSDLRLGTTGVYIPGAMLKAVTRSYQ